MFGPVVHLFQRQCVVSSQPPAFIRFSCAKQSTNALQGSTHAWDTQYTLNTLTDWLNEFERVQWLLRLSPRLRRLHGD